MSNLEYNAAKHNEKGKDGQPINPGSNIPRRVIKFRKLDIQ